MALVGTCHIKFMTGCDYSNIRSDLRHVIAQSISNAHLTLHKAGSNLAKTKIIKTLAFQTISSHQLFTPTAKTRSAARSVARLATDTLSDPDRLPTYGNGAHVPNGTNLCRNLFQIYTNLHKSAVHEFLALLESLHVHKFMLFAENSRFLHEIELSTWIYITAWVLHNSYKIRIRAAFAWIVVLHEPGWFFNPCWGSL